MPRFARFFDAERRIRLNCSRPMAITAEYGTPCSDKRMGRASLVNCKISGASGWVGSLYLRNISCCPLSARSRRYQRPPKMDCVYACICPQASKTTRARLPVITLSRMSKIDDIGVRAFVDDNSNASASIASSVHAQFLCGIGSIGRGCHRT
jgi:hypothetical protein